MENKTVINHFVEFMKDEYEIELPDMAVEEYLKWKAVDSDGWISVEDRLPECWSQHKSDYGSGYVIGYTKYGEYVITQLWNNNRWEGDDNSEGNFITHWMPLPKAPKLIQE